VAHTVQNNALEQAVASGLRMQLAWGAPVAVVESGGLQVHVMEGPHGHHYCVEWAHRFDRPLAEGSRALMQDAVLAAAAALTSALGRQQGGSLDRATRRSRRQPLPSWHTQESG